MELERCLCFTVLAEDHALEWHLDKEMGEGNEAEEERGGAAAES